MDLAGAFSAEALAQKLQGTLDDEEAKEAKRKAFRSKMKSHYKGEFNMAAAMRAKPISDDEDDD